VNIAGSTALVTGANRGLGRRLATELLARGATVYAGARNPDTVDLPGAKVVQLNVTDPDSVAAAARLAGDVTLLINNAGSGTGAGLLD
jgi:NAD(P)-dependent dehydrogenase (short-subunit alcohol dehydrogenase family)